MIPLRDNIKHKKWPIVNTFLIGLNFLIFIYEATLGSNAGAFFLKYAVVPSQFLSSTTLSFTRLAPLFSAMFLHAGLLHIGGNMLFLYIFGDNVEDSMGHLRYLFFYLLVGVLSSLAHIYANPASSVPSLGASGAISGVLGAYFLLFPKARVSTLIFLLFFFYTIEVPAWIFIGLWFLLQIRGGAAAANSSSGGIAWWAHIGGFVSGLILILFFRRRRKEDFVKYF